MMRVLWFFIAGLWYAVDYITKVWAKDELVHRTIEVNAFLEWRLAFNKGAAFSLGANFGGWQKWFFIAVAIIVSLWLIVELYRQSRSIQNQSILYPLALASILGGALGNLIDRMQHGMVTDFIHLHYHQYSWPIFNIADIGISVGVGLMILDWAFRKQSKNSHD